MTYPNTLIFVDLASNDPAAAGEFYAQVFGWRDDPRPYGVFHRLVPGQNFLHKDGLQSEIGNLHLGIFDAANARPHPEPAGVEPRSLSMEGRKARVWILWRNHYWKEFNGYNHAFRDPWGNEIVLWGKAGESPSIPPAFTRE
jgi:hypothetical protein